MSNFTEGPWHIETATANEVDGLYIDAGFSGEICDLYHINERGNLFQKPNMEANANLIAAAPDMYEALEDIGRGKLQGPGDFETYVKAVCERVLVKARGEA